MDRLGGGKACLRLGTALAICGVLSACGGGGGGGGGGVISTPAPPPAPTPTPTPAPTPTPTPPPVNFNTAEVRRSEGPSFHNAVSAWQSGITGAGSTIAIVDTGIDTDSPEFAGRLSASSQDVAGNGTVEAEDDHGTDVAMVAAAALDNAGVVGIAYGADILALRADSPGSCATESDPNGDGCVFDDRDVATGIDRAVAAHATVINLSLGGGSPSSQLLQAVQRAVAAGLTIIVSAGNDGESADAGIDPDQPDPFASGILGAGQGSVIIAGSVDENGQFSTFSNRAGSRANAFLSARGEGICCTYENGEIKITTDPDGSRYVSLFSGTSFSAPQIAGAVALLKQAFPNLSGVEIVSILLDSARDAGAAGTDATYGRGILDIARALAPQGATTLAGSSTRIALGDDTGTGSGPMGDALSRAPLATILTDKYDRAYNYDFGQGLRGASLQPRLRTAVEHRGQRIAMGRSGMAMAFTIGEGHRAGGARWGRQLQLTPEDAEAARVLAARVALRLAPGTDLGFAISEGAQGLIGQLQGQERPAFLIATDAGADAGFLQGSEASIALRRRFGEWGVTASAQSGHAWLGNYRIAQGYLDEDRERYATRTFGLAVDRALGPVEAALGMSWLDEDRTILGSYFHDALGGGGASTLFLDAGAGYRFAGAWRLGADVRQGFTRPEHVGSIGSGSSFVSRAWSIDLTRRNALQPGDSFGVRLSQPLRVESGGLSLGLPVAYDYATERPIYGVRRLALTPEGRELMGEIAWHGSLWGGDAAASLFLRKDPGHYADAPDDGGAVVKWSRRF